VSSKFMASPVIPGRASVRTRNLDPNYKIPGLRLTAHPGMTFKNQAAFRLRMRSISASSQ
jgi:hypothetical protein